MQLLLIAIVQLNLQIGGCTVKGVVHLAMVDILEVIVIAANAGVVVLGVSMERMEGAIDVLMDVLHAVVVQDVIHAWADSIFYIILVIQLVLLDTMLQEGIAQIAQ